ncbi:MAG: Uma2 family endonuclease [Gammaproteobacteria bacterium]
MARAYTVIRGLEEFSAAREQFNLLMSRLQSEEMSRREHGEVEATIAQDGNELLRRLLQGHLDLRAKSEERPLEGAGLMGCYAVTAAKVDMDLFGEAPDWVVEVLSPATAGHDQAKKRRVYERHGIKEDYWLVHPTDPRRGIR